MDIIEKLKARKAVIHIRFGQQQHGILITEAERDALLALVEPQWQPIETAPKDAGTLLVCSYYRTLGAPGKTSPVLETAWWANVDGGYWRTGPGFRVQPTHWMPLPAPPSPRPSPSSETPETRA